jgi:hypothetical protein
MNGTADQRHGQPGKLQIGPIQLEIPWERESPSL